MIDTSAVLTQLDELRRLTADAHGAQRVAWSPVWLKAREWLIEKASTLPVEVHRDPAGNLWLTMAGEQPQALVVGSHLDSVPNGGWLDGCLGVVTGLEVLRAFATKYGGKPPYTLRLVDWADEEGARFGRSLFGSSAFAGTHTLEADRVRTDRDGTTLEAALGACGIAVNEIPSASREREHIAAYLELHIEQGPVLEHAARPLGAVTGTKGVERWAITFQGQEAHSGSTPMRVRRDALAACAKLALAIRPIARQHPDAVATMGSVKTFPGIVTAVVGRCEATLDLRDLDAVVLASLLQEARTASEEFAREEGCTVAWSKIWSIEPVPFHPRLIQFCEGSIGEITGEATDMRLPSGPLHDAAEVARAGVPTTMMFVQSLGGLSHNAAEDTQREHLEQAARAFYALSERTLAWLGAEKAARRG